MSRKRTPSAQNPLVAMAERSADARVAAMVALRPDGSLYVGHTEDADTLTIIGLLQRAIVEMSLSHGDEAE